MELYVSRKRFNNNTNIFILNLPAMYQEILKRKEKKYISNPVEDKYLEMIRLLEEELAIERKKREYLERERRMNEELERHKLSIYR